MKDFVLSTLLLIAVLSCIPATADTYGSPEMFSFDESEFSQRDELRKVKRHWFHLSGAGYKSVVITIYGKRVVGQGLTKSDAFRDSLDRIKYAKETDPRYIPVSLEN